MLLNLSLAASVVGLFYALWCAYLVKRQDKGSAELQLPYSAIRDAAGAFLRTQYLTILIVGVILLVPLLIIPAFGYLTGLGFVIGGFCSAIAGIAGMRVSVRANVRTTAAARKGILPALKIALHAGSVTGFLVGSLALASVTSFYLFLGWMNNSSELLDLTPLVGLGFGASLVSVFARLGGGIFTKAADVGADLVGKIELGIPEDDPRNPAVIADNVGDNVGDCAGMAADLFESYAVTLIATILLASKIIPDNTLLQHYPLAIGSMGILASIIGVTFAYIGQGGRILNILFQGVIITSLLAAIGFYAVSVKFMDATSLFTVNQLFFSTLTGIVVALLLIISTIFYTATNFSPVQRIAHASLSGHATNIIAGLAVGMKSTLIPTFSVVIGIIIAYSFAGVYGIALAAVGMLSLTPIIITLDAYGPVTDNAGGIAEMAHQPEQLRAVTDALDAVGNTTKSVTKSFAIGSAGLAALVLFSTYAFDFSHIAMVLDFSLTNPYILAGLFIGALLPMIFSGLILDTVGIAASHVVAEVRDQFKKYPEIMIGTRKPDYDRTVTLLTKSSLRGMMIPGLIPIVIPVLIVVIGGLLGSLESTIQLLGGTLIGAIICGYMMAISMSTGGAAWDNAKKYIEAGHEGGKGSPAHLAAITGDTVGDPYKDTAGPAINPMIKVLNLVALLLVPFLYM